MTKRSRNPLDHPPSGLWNAAPLIAPVALAVVIGVMLKLIALWR